MSDGNGSREAAFEDGLCAEELATVERLKTMPPAMQVFWVYVMLSRKIDSNHAALSSEIAALRRPAWRTAADRIGYVIGVALAAVLGAQTK